MNTEIILLWISISLKFNFNYDFSIKNLHKYNSKSDFDCSAIYNKIKEYELIYLDCNCVIIRNIIKLYFIFQYNPFL